MPIVELFTLTFSPVECMIWSSALCIMSLVIRRFLQMLVNVPAINSHQLRVCRVTDYKIIGVVCIDSIA